MRSLYPMSVSPATCIVTQRSRCLLFSYYKSYRDEWDAAPLNEFELMCPEA